MDLNNGVPKIGVRHKFAEPASPNIFVVIDADDDGIALFLVYLERSLEVQV